MTQSLPSRRAPAEALASFAVVGVALVMAVLALGNLAWWLYAQNAVVAAAQEAAVVASREDGTPLDGQQIARSLLASSLGSRADTLAVVVYADQDVAVAEVRGSWPIVLLGPLQAAPLGASATLERQRFRPGGR